MSPQTTTNTAFLIVPGSFTPPTLYTKIISLLQAQNYLASVIPLQSASERPQGPATFEEDASAIHSALLALVEEGKDVVLVMHSYGGYPGTEASKGLSKKEREKEGKEGGIVRLVYMAAFIPAVGGSIVGGLGENVPDSIKLAGDYMTLPFSDYVKIFNDLPDAEGKYWMSQMLNHSTISFSGVLTYPGYKYIPGTYLLTGNDKIVPVEAQRQMIEFARSEGANVDVVETEAGHCPVLSIPEKTVEILIEAARGV
ncbi:hypothetical protein VTL71DRAFT_13689 [Oculimacula yallundae]|uniref:AB hydrolase-1 domain-containing protein n=1 Tax=Oculimacula yallundae TaxID=86028 RepID=A0ABR4CL69_9HELO